MMDFYQELNEANALEWYNLCPQHLRKKVDAVLNGVKTGEDALRADNEKLWMQVYTELGYHRPSKLPPEENVGDGYSKSEIEQHEQRKAWVKRYNDLLLVDAVLKTAPGIQSERKMLMQALGHSGGGNGLPQQANVEGLDDTQTATIRWLQATGITPLERLAEIYRSDDPGIKISDQIAAASKLMEYVHKKVPVKSEVKQETNLAAIGVDISKLRGLNSSELDALEALLKKGIQN